ncbi:MAG: glycosyltransferase family 2 protein [Chloroflexi bacterium]|nr:glycosyltransferase family 2 protein [Chloroflexota bacterium]
MEGSPKVSLLVPVFNRESLLVDCLDSALRQSFSDLEVVVVDGASTDGTWDVCQNYAKADARVRIFREERNRGPVLGWERCIEESRGEFATFLWSDDILQPEFLARTVKVLERRDIGFVFTAAEIGPTPGDGSVHYSHPSGVIESRTFINASLRDGDVPVSPACALFRLADIRRNFRTEVPTLPPFDLKSTGAGVDLLLYLLTAKEYSLVANIAEPLAFFRAHKDSLTIDGRGGAVTLGYAVTKTWFARSIGDSSQARSIAARHWARQIAASRHPIWPRSATQSYGLRLTIVDLLLATSGLLKQFVVSRLSPSRRSSAVR